MKLSELKKQVDALNKLAKKEKVDPEVRMATLPNFPMECTIRPKLTSSLSGDYSLNAIDKEHTVYFAEHNEIGFITGEIRTALGWD
jgi:hypothetical protein